jgi:NADP-dependent 3-hydroxy acid dehydrogenase YdfG
MVTSGNSGVGKLTAIRLAVEGANVAIIGRDAITSEATVAEISGVDGIDSFYKTDVRNKFQIGSMIHGVLAAYGQVDLAFNNAGTSSVTSDFVSICVN